MATTLLPDTRQKRGKGMRHGGEWGRGGGRREGRKEDKDNSFLPEEGVIPKPQRSP